MIANDPDADRCAVAVADPEADGGWRMLRGDEVGALLGRRTWSAATRSCRGTVRHLDRLVVAARPDRRGARPRLRRDADRLQVDRPRRPGLRLRLRGGARLLRRPRRACATRTASRAALLVAELAATLKAEGRTLLDRLDDLAARARPARDRPARRSGSRTCRSIDGRDGAAAGRAADRALGGRTVERADDLATGSAGLPPTDGLRYRLADGGRVVVRPSGTEPKLKAYLEVVVPVADGDVGTARRTAAADLSAIKRDLAATLALG